MDHPFTMPAVGSWPERGGWVVRELCKDFRLLFVQSCGLVGNLGYESVGFTAFHEGGVADGLGGYGWAQWTGPRRREFFAFCDDRGLRPRSDRANYLFLCEELAGEYAGTIRQLRRCTSLSASVWSVGQTYERPGGTTATELPGFAGRLARAREIYVHGVANAG